MGLQNRRCAGTASSVLSAFINKNKVHSFFMIHLLSMSGVKCQTELSYGTQDIHTLTCHFKHYQTETKGEVTKKRHAPFLNIHLKHIQPTILFKT